MTSPQQPSGYSIMIDRRSVFCMCGLSSRVLVMFLVIGTNQFHRSLMMKPYTLMANIKCLTHSGCCFQQTTLNRILRVLVPVYPTLGV